MMSEDVIIRAPEFTDAAEIARVHTAVWRSTYGGTVPEAYLDAGSIDRRTAHWQRVLRLHSTDHAVAIAELDSAVVGLAHCGVEDGRRKLFALYVLDDYHGTGIGQQLLDAVLTEEPTELWVAQDNHRAVAFYRRNGFIPDGVAQDFPGVDGFLTIRMMRANA
ncbi:GNAT family N-acetyltransferase [Rhodococcus sp. P1Y]|uniref:GNAT family N-acetyltransferase n=1 Tax=Rhodococcus sp. P1Y TaxID=1302308 RepID=UPI001F34C9B7|nr:GNAT family N-acetyltransferase [Rhodococcus sp. P1Y]